MLYPKYWNTCNFSKNIIANSNHEILFIQLQPEGFALGYPDKLFNLKHPLIKPYINIDKIKNPYEIGEIEKNLDEFKDKINQSFQLYSFDFKEKKNSKDIRQAYLDELNISANLLWESYKKYKLIPSKEKFKKLTEKDFSFGLTIKF